MGRIVEGYREIQKRQEEAMKAIVSSMRKAGRGLPRTGILFGIPREDEGELDPPVIDVALGRLIDSGVVWMRSFKPSGDGEAEEEKVVYYLNKSLQEKAA